MVILIGILVLAKAPLILTACLISAVLATLIGFVINNRFTKLSLHSVGMAGCVTVLCLTLTRAWSFLDPIRFFGWLGKNSSKTSYPASDIDWLDRASN